MKALLALFFKQRDFDTIAAFTFLWALTKFSYFFNFYNSMEAFGSHIIYFILIGFALCFPRCLFSLLLLNIAQLISDYHFAPIRANHGMYIAFVDFGILLTLMYSAISTVFRKTIDFDNITRSLGPIVLTNLAILYFFAAFHKTNWDFLDPEVACTRALTEGFVYLLPFTVEAVKEQFIHFAIYYTLVFEYALPILIFVKRTRFIIILLGIITHGFWIPNASTIADFSVIVLSSYFFLFSTAARHMIINVLKNLNGISQNQFLKTFPFNKCLFILLGGIVTFTFLTIGPIPEIIRIQTVFATMKWAFPVSAFLFLSSIYIFVIIKNFHSRTFETGKFSIGLFSGVLLFIACFSPYLGFRTVPAISMFSNLRTYKPMWNHLIVPSALKIFDYEENYYEIVKTDSPWLRLYTKLKSPFWNHKDGYFLPLEGVIALTRLYDGTAVLKKANQEYVLEIKEGRVFLDGVDLSYPTWKAKIMSFRFIDLAEKQPCRW